MLPPILLALKGQWLRLSRGHSLICAGRKLKRRNRLRQHQANDEPIPLFVYAQKRPAGAFMLG